MLYNVFLLKKDVKKKFPTIIDILIPEEQTFHETTFGSLGSLSL